jgi:S1-C subfamily serine protease
VAPADSPILASVRSSGILGLLTQGVPPNGTLGSIVLRAGVVPSLNGPIVLADEPLPEYATTPGVLAAQPSVLQVAGEACGSIITGTGWVAGPGLIVTNAHVVAGQRETTLSGGPGYEGFRATVTAFDPVNDVAVLTADGQALPPAIPLNRAWKHGQPAAVIGFPRGGIRRVMPARIDRVARWPTEPLGGGKQVDAPILAFRAEVQHGNSGGPVLAEDGTALGLVVAKGLGQRIEAAYGVASADLQPILVQGAHRQPVSTGPCLTPEDEITGGGK